MEQIKTQPPTKGPAARILEVADRLFYEQGYAATGVNQLIREAAVAKASFYQHFPTKNDLVIAYLNHRREAWFQEMVKSIECHRTPERRLLAIFDFLSEWLQASGFRGCAFLNTVPEFEDNQSMPRQIVREAKLGMRDYLGELCAEAGHEDAGDEVFLLLEGALAQAAVMADVWPVAVARKAAQRRLNAPV